MVRSHEFWFLVLLIGVIVGPYVLGVRPRTNRQWSFIAFTVAFLAWVLLMARVNSS